MSDNQQKPSPAPEGRRGDLSFFHQKRVMLPTVILGLVGTVLSWFSFPSRVFSFLPPFLAVYALGHLLYPRTEEGPDVESGFMSGYRYQEKSARRWQIIMVAGIIAALNYLLVSMYWEGRS